jgi:pyoverdine/dityrosine biosynthesis protein Dit1
VSTQQSNIGYSALEMEWQKCQSSCSFVSRSVPRYDVAGMMFYVATEHVGQPRQPTEIAALQPSTICEAMIAQIKGEIHSVVNYGELPPPWSTQRRDVFSVLATDYLHTCDAFMWDGHLDAIFNGSPSLWSMSDTELLRFLGVKADTHTAKWQGFLTRLQEQRQYLAQLGKEVGDANAARAWRCFLILCHADVGELDNLLYVNFLDFGRVTHARFAAKTPLQFVLPSFPFKDQNPFRTASRADHIDFGEVALLIRLHSLALALAQIFPYGVKWLIVSDGLVYSDFLGIAKEEAIRYRERLREWRNRLNLQQTIHILDYSEAIEHAGEFTVSLDGQDSSSVTFAQVFDRIRDIIKSEIARGTNSLLSEKFAVAVRGMMWNINLRNLHLKYGHEALWAALTGSAAPSELVAAELSRQATEAAISYHCFNLASKTLRLLETVFPQGIRATVHPKLGQIAIPRIGDEYPWNGVAYINDEVIGPKCVETRLGYRIARETKVSAYYFVSDDAPFYFRSIEDGHA